jgi:hypothetical protein
MANQIVHDIGQWGGIRTFGELLKDNQFTDDLVGLLDRLFEDWSGCALDIHAYISLDHRKLIAKFLEEHCIDYWRDSQIFKV